MMGFKPRATALGDSMDDDGSTGVVQQQTQMKWLQGVSYTLFWRQEVALGWDKEQLVRSKNLNQSAERGSLWLMEIVLQWYLTWVKCVTYAKL